MAQEVPETGGTTVSQTNNSQEDNLPGKKSGFFANIWDKVKGTAKEGATSLLFGFFAGIFAKHGWTLILKRIANRGKVILKEIGEFASSGSNFLDILDNKIRDDGTLAENSIKDLIDAGKPLIAEGKDVIISIHPKKLL